MTGSGPAHPLRNGSLPSGRVPSLELIGPGLIFALAAVLRLGWPGVNSYSFDEARLSLIALDMVRGRVPALLGMPSSASLPNAPGAAWVLGFPYLLSTDPLFATQFVAFLSWLAVLGVWWLARAAWGRAPAFLAAVLMGLLPYAVLYSRNIWAQNLLAPSAVLWAILAIRGIAGHKRNALAGHFFLAGFVWQIHYAGAPLAIGSLWLFWRFGLWKRWKPVLAGLGLAAAAALPFYLGIRCCAPAFSPELKAGLSSRAMADLDAFAKLGGLLAGEHWGDFLLGGKSSVPNGSLIRALGWLIVLIALGGLLWIAGRAARDWRLKAKASPRIVLEALLPAWFLSAPLAFTIHTIPVYGHYMLISLVPALLAVSACLGLLPWRPVRLALIIQVVGFMLWEGAWVARAISFAGVSHTPGGMGTPLKYPRAAAAAMKTGAPIVVHALSESPELDGDSAGFKVLLWDYAHRLVNGNQALLIPGSGGHLFFVRPDLAGVKEVQLIGLASSATIYPRRHEDVPYLDFPVGQVKLEGFAPVGPFALQNGARLSGYRADRLGSKLRISLKWDLTSGGGSSQFHQYNHFRAGADAVLLEIKDGPASSRSWETGDTLITWNDFDWPRASRPFWVDVGMYSYPDLQRSPWINTPAPPLDPVRLGPIGLPDQ